MQPIHATPERRTITLIAIGIIAAIFAAYAGVVHCGFIHLDDTSHVFENDIVRAGLTADGVRNVFTHSHASLYVPLTTLSFMADVSLFGLNPAAMHIENVLWHTGAAVLLFLALHRMTGRIWPPAIVAALFGLHTINVESVAWVSERKNVLCAFFFTAALLAWSRWAVERRKFAWWLALMSFAAALFAKPMAVTFPCVLLLLDVWPLRRTGWRLLWEKLPFFGLTFVFSFIATESTKKLDSNVGLDYLPLDSRVSNALCSYGAYLRDLVWPDTLAVFYPHPFVTQWPEALAVLAGLATMLGFALWKRRSHPYLLIGLLIFFGMIVPNLGLVQVGSQARADRFTYFGQIGFFIAIVWLADAWLPAIRSLRVFAATVPLIALGAATAIQVTKWENDLVLFEHAVAVTPHNAMALEHTGRAYSRLGDTASAIQKFEQSLKVYPKNPICWNELGAAHLSLGENTLAARDFRNSLSLNPADDAMRCLFATALGALGETSAAEAEFRKVLSTSPSLWQVHFRYGLFLEKLGRVEECKTRISEALRLAPQNTMVVEAWKRIAE